jgi:hypothetical protein
MEAAENRESDDRCAASERTALGLNRYLLRYSVVRSGRVEIAERVLFEDALQVCLSEDDDVVETFTPDATDESLA